MAPVALALYYEYFRLEGLPIEYRLERRFHLAASAAWCGTISIAALLRFELSPDWVAAGWALLALGLIAAAWRSGRELFLTQSLVLALATTFRGGLHNLYERSYLPGPFWHSRDRLHQRDRRAVVRDVMLRISRCGAASEAADATGSTVDSAQSCITLSRSSSSCRSGLLPLCWL